MTEAAKKVMGRSDVEINKIDMPMQVTPEIIDAADVAQKRSHHSDKKNQYY